MVLYQQKDAEVHTRRDKQVLHHTGFAIGISISIDVLIKKKQKHTHREDSNCRTTKRN